MKKLSIITIAIALVLIMAQCKKNVETIATPVVDGNWVDITVNVGGNSKHDVNTNTGAVTYTSGDVLYVGNNGKFVGTLTYNSGAFTGSIVNPSEDDYLGFYFVGGLTPSDAPVAGTTTTFTVNIGNQTTTLPVLSYGRSSKKYQSGDHTYTAILGNKCALVKFETNLPNETITLSYLEYVANVNFIEKNITSGDSWGLISFNTDANGVGWAILQSSKKEQNVTASCGAMKGNCTIPKIENNDFLEEGITLNLSGEFSVSSTTRVSFSPGNLQYKEGTGWRFAQHQYDAIGSWNTSDWVDLFGWGTWGNGNDPLNVSTDSPSYLWSTDFEGTLNGHNDWFTLSDEQWQYIIDHSTFGKATVNGIHGIVILPDGSSLTVDTTHDNWGDNTYTAEVWAADMESQGAVFLPAAGYRNGSDVGLVGDYGYYWSRSSSGSPSGSGDAKNLYLSQKYAQVSVSQRANGHSVRLVRTVQ